MRRKLLRSYLASLLILAFAASLLPTIYANAGQSVQSPRRGKNGIVPDKTETKPIAKSPQPGSSSQVDNRNSTTEPNAADAQTENDDDLTSPAESSAATGEPRNVQQSPPPQAPPQASKKKPEPPPFDRPPMNPDSGSQSASDRSAPPDTAARPDASARRSTQRSNDAPATTTSRSSGPPVLHRPSATESRTGTS